MHVLLCALFLAAPRPTVAILPPLPDKGADVWVRLALADDLNTRLLIHTRFDPGTLERVYPLNIFSWRQVLAAARGEGIDPTQPLGNGDFARLVRQLGTDWIFTGKYTTRAASIRLRWRLQGLTRKKTGVIDLQAANLAGGAEELAAAVLIALGQSPKGMGGHQLQQMPPAAMKAYGDALAIMGRQSLDPSARVVLSHEELQRAHLLLSAATNAAPTFMRAWVERGIASALLGEIKRSEEEAVQAMINADAYEPVSALGLYFLYVQQGKRDEGIQALQQAAETHLGFLHGMGYLATAYARAGDNHKALEIFTQYQARVPRNPWVRVKRAEQLAAIGKQEQAIKETAAVLREFPESLMVRRALAARQIDAEKYDAARETLEKALAMHSRHPALLALLATVEIAAGSPKAALQLAREAVAILDINRGGSLAGYAQATLGHALALTGQIDAAYAALRRALALGLSTQDRLVLLRDPRLGAFLKDPRSPIRLDGGRGH